MNAVGRLPRQAWAHIIKGSVIITLLAAIGSLVIAYAAMTIFSDGMPPIGAVISFVAPVALAGPSSLYQLIRNEQLRLANHKLEKLASVDWLTDCLNRRAFTSRVAEVRKTPGCGAGAFLIVDADHFKTINDRFGHDRGDEVLQQIAADIRSAVRQADLVGRIGGEEFGIFLPGVGMSAATEIAERIRKRVGGRALPSLEGDSSLSVSIGGAVFEDDASFTDLFRAADQRLYLAKRSGRNRVRLTRMPVIDDAGASGELAFG